MEQGNDNQTNDSKGQIQQKKTNSLSVVGLIFAFLIPLLGFILSIVSLNQIKKNNEGGKGLAVAGIVLSSIFMFIGLILIFSLAAGINNATKNSSDENETSKTANTSKTYRFSERADKQSTDLELLAGETGVVDGRKLTIVSVDKKTSLGEYMDAPSGKIYIVANVTIENVSDRTQTYNPYDFRLQTASGQVIDPYYGIDNQLNSGDLVSGGKVSGNVFFEAPAEAGNQYIIYKPNPVISDRIIVQVKQ